jgi:hypothetical protein
MMSDPHCFSCTFLREYSLYFFFILHLVDLVFFTFVRLLTLAAIFSTGTGNVAHPGFENAAQIICVIFQRQITSCCSLASWPPC